MRTLEVLSGVGKKRDRTSGGTDSLLTMANLEAHDKAAAAGHSVQTGIEAFFTAKPPAVDSKPSAVSNKKSSAQVVNLCDSDQDEANERPSSKPKVALVETPKQDASAAATKSDSSEVKVSMSLPGSAKRKESPCEGDSESAGSPEKKTKVGE